jgi:hypothetical protein
MKTLTLAFVHGYSVTNLDTYGEMPLRLMQEAGTYGYQLKIEHIFLGRYISFNDEVRLEDIARAMEQAVQEQLAPTLAAGERFACITHSTGGPLVRTWWNNYYKDQKLMCPMSHLVMLAPANYGSALAQLGKSRLSRIKSWFDGVEPGQRVLNWLELGSGEAWKLNKDWILNGQKYIGPNGIFPFSLIGQDIDRKLYDHLNSYTGELGSDGVVRVAAANQNSRYVKLNQETPKLVGGKWQAPNLEISLPDFKEAPATPFRVVTYKSHSGEEMGIMRSPLKDPKDPKGTEVVNAIFRCIGVTTDADYKKLTADFAKETVDVQEKGLVEEDKRLFGKKYFIHDRYSMILFRLVDSEGHAVTDFDLILTGENHDPNGLPAGFFADRQCNGVNKSTVTYFFNYDVLHGRKAMTVNGYKLDELKGINKLGLIIRPRPDDGFIRYLPCEIVASKELFEKALQPNSTTMIDICIQRVVSDEVFRFEKVKNDKGVQNVSFKKATPGNGIVK